MDASEIGVWGLLALVAAGAGCAGGGEATEHGATDATTKGGSTGAAADDGDGDGDDGLGSTSADTGSVDGGSTTHATTSDSTTHATDGGSSDTGACEGACAEGLRFEDFASDPGWDALNNHVVVDPCPSRTNAFGFSDTAHAGGDPGELGGRAERATRRGVYWVATDVRAFSDELVARGRLSLVSVESGGGVQFGWFDGNSDGWRTPNSIAVRLDGGSGSARVLIDYGTSMWRAGGIDTGVLLAADGSSHTWELIYHPDGAGGDGSVTLELDGQLFEVALDPGHKADGATFDRFGMMTQQIPGAAIEAYLDDIEYTGGMEFFDADPGWMGAGNDVSFEDCELDDAHDYGWSDTAHAGGEPGELGGLVWRTEPSQPEARTYVGDVVGPFSLDHELYAEGTIALTRASSDSGLRLGWFNATTSVGDVPPSFVGVTIEGPSREGHLFRPVYRDVNGEGVDGLDADPPHIHPDGGVHTFAIHYLPDGSGGATLTTTFDGLDTQIDVAPEHVAAGAQLERFGLLNMMEGGHHVELWVDDLAYTAQ